jgi:CII-binding regulator of phage lambda lysogenization HflD
MKLTKDDFSRLKTKDGDYMYLDNYNPLEMIDQILKNQEDAEKWRKQKIDVSDYVTKGLKLPKHLQNEKIVERLKKRIEECENQIEYLHYKSENFGIYPMILKELQKILEGKE